MNAAPAATEPAHPGVRPMLLNIVLFQITWLCFVGGAGAGRWWLGLLPLAVLAGWQLRISPWRAGDLKLIALAVPLGFLADSLLLRGGWLSYASPVPWSSLAPIWMSGLWIGFALTLNHSLRWFHGKPLASVAFGGLGGPLAYWAAERAWDALDFHEPRLSGLVAVGVAWALLMPLLVGIAGRWRAPARPA